MRGCVAVLLLSLVVPSASFGQCTYSPVVSGQYRSSILDIAISGNDLWAATSYGVQLFDRSVDPPAPVASLALPGVTKVVRVSANGTAYVASGTTVQIVTSSNRKLQVANAIETGATINDLLLTTVHLYVANANGIQQYDLLDPLHPARTAATFTTSSPNVRSLTLIGSNLYAADGDSTVEIFNIAVSSLVQPLAPITSLATSSFVETNNGRLYVTDLSAQQTEIFAVTATTATKVATLPLGSATLAPLSGDAAYAAGRDRSIHAYDFSTGANPIELFRADLSPTGGTMNRIFSLLAATNRLYAAAGDLGLATFDTTAFTAPFPVRSYSGGAPTSILSTGDRVYVGNATTGITEYLQSATGALTQARSWDNHLDVVQDASTNGFLITSTGSSVTFWTTASTTPTAVSSVSFPRTVSKAVLNNGLVTAMLDDGTIATADMSQTAPVAQVTTFPKQNFLVRSGSAIAIAQVLDTGRTIIRYYATGNLAATPVLTDMEGVATSFALSGGNAAVFTFRGISIVNVAAGGLTVLPKSNNTLVRQLSIDGNNVFALTDTSLALWNAQSGTLVREFALPSSGVSFNVAPGSTIADLATFAGITTVATSSTSKQPVAIVAPSGNSYFKKITANADRVYLLGTRGVDIYSPAMHYSGSLATNGVIDVAAAPGAVYSLSASGVVTLHGIDGNVIAQSTIDEGSDAEPLAIAAVNGAVWVSISKGCLSGGCEKRTLIFDPRNNALVQTASLPGGVVDVTTNGTRAYAIFNLPSEVRVYNVADPFHPAQLVSRATEGTRPPLSIAYANGKVYALGEKLFVYDETSLNKTTESLGDYTDDPTGAVTFADQQIRIDGNCTVVTGRSFAPQTYATNGFTASTTFATPAAVKSIASTPGRLYVLTDYSLEIWSTTPLAKPARRRTAK